MEVDVAVKLAAPDVVCFDYRRPPGTCRSPSPPDDHERLHDASSCSSRLLSDDFSSHAEASVPSSADFDAVDPDRRSAVTGDRRFVASTSSTSRPLVCGHFEHSDTRTSPRRRRYYGSMWPQDLGVRLSSDLDTGDQTVDVGSATPTSYTYQEVDLSSRTGGTVLSAPELVESLPNVHKPAMDVVPSSVNDTVRRVSYLPDIECKYTTSADITKSVVCGPKCHDTGVIHTHAIELSPCSTIDSPSARGQVSPLPGLVKSATEAISTSPSVVRSSNNVLYSSDTVDKDKVPLNDSEVRTSQGNGVCPIRQGVSNADVVKNCALSTQFATDADLEADLLSAKLLREFREAIKSAVDSIATGRSHSEDDDLSRYTVPSSNFASAQSFVTVERVRQFGDSFDRSPSASIVTSLSSHSLANVGVERSSESAFRQFRMSQIPTLNGVNRCKRSVMRDDLTAVTHWSAVTPNVLRHRRSLPDANQLRSLSLTASRDAVLPNRTNVRTRSSLVIGGCS